MWRQPTGTKATQRYKTHCTGKLTHAARRFWSPAAYVPLNPHHNVTNQSSLKGAPAMNERNMFLSALDITGPAARRKYLGQACGRISVTGTCVR